MTLATHELLANFSAVNLDLQARLDEAYRRLLARFVDLYATRWGEKVTARPDNCLQARVVFQGLTKEDARTAWQPVIDFANANSADYEGHDGRAAAALPARKFWDADFWRRYEPNAVVFDSRPGASPSDFCRAGAAAQAGAFWYAYTSAWLPASLLREENRSRLVDAGFAGSRHWGIALGSTRPLREPRRWRSTRSAIRQ